MNAKTGIALSFALLLLSPAFAQESAGMSFTYCISDPEAHLKPENLGKIGFLVTVLMNTREIRMHNLGGVSTNTVYVAKDGHREFVYDADGQLVTDSLNKGSYNYYAVADFPLEHFAYDNFPWMLWGNAADDPSTVEERASAYFEDFWASCRKYFERRASLKAVPLKYLKDGDRIEVANFFLTILADEALAGYSFTEDPGWMDDESARLSFGEAFRSAFLKMMAKAAQ